MADKKIAKYNKIEKIRHVTIVEKEKRDGSGTYKSLELRSDSQIEFAYMRFDVVPVFEDGGNGYYTVLLEYIEDSTGRKTTYVKNAKKIADGDAPFVANLDLTYGKSDPVQGRILNISQPIKSKSGENMQFGDVVLDTGVYSMVYFMKEQPQMVVGKSYNINGYIANDGTFKASSIVEEIPTFEGLEKYPPNLFEVKRIYINVICPKCGGKLSFKYQKKQGTWSCADSQYGCGFSEPVGDSPNDNNYEVKISVFGNISDMKSFTGPVAIYTDGIKSLGIDPMKIISEDSVESLEELIFNKLNMKIIPAVYSKFQKTSEILNDKKEGTGEYRVEPVVLNNLSQCVD